MKRLWIFILISLLGVGMAPFNWTSLHGDDIIIDRDQFNLTCRLNKWDRECSLRLSIPVSTTREINEETSSRLRYESNDFDIVFDRKAPSAIEAERQCEDGGVEFTIVLKRRPPSNSWAFPIDTQNLQFWYQPPLSLEEINMGFFRPTNVVGSYAAYRIDRKKVYTDEVEARRYKTGKVFHIYRPKVFDSSPTPGEIWADLNISNGVLSITIDQDFLDRAIYPVFIDPTFGYESGGASSSTLITYTKGAEYANSSGSGDAEKLTAYLSRHAPVTGYNVKGAIYDAASPCNLIQGTDEISSGVGTSPAWVDLNFSTQPSISDSTSYTLMAWAELTGGSAHVLLHFDTGDSADKVNAYNVYNGWPSTLSVVSDTWDFSIYCTFSGAVVLVVADANHAHSTDAILLSQLHNLIVQAAGHSHLADSLVLTQAHVLAIAEALHNHSVDSPTLIQAHVLAVAAALHAQSADNIILTQAHILAIAETLHGLSSDSITLSQAHQLIVSACGHGHLADNITLAVGAILVMNDALHGHTTDSILLSQVHQLAVNSADHNHLADNVVLFTGALLVVSDALHDHAADGITLTQVHNLLVNAGLHTLASDPIILSQVHSLIVNSAAHEHLADNIDLNLAAIYAEMMTRIKEKEDVLLIGTRKMRLIGQDDPTYITIDKKKEN